MDTPPTDSHYSQPKTPGIATASLVFGILSFILFPIGLILSIPAIITGHIAHKRIRNAGGLLGGDGIGLAGMIIGYLNFGLWLAVMPLVAVTVPKLAKTYVTAQQNACISNLRIIDAATEQWAIENKKEEGAPVAISDLAEYFRENTHPQCPAKGAYTVGPVGQFPACSMAGHELDY